jgi:hypothetical protein
LIELLSAVEVRAAFGDTPLSRVALRMSSRIQATCAVEFEGEGGREAA